MEFSADHLHHCSQQNLFLNMEKPPSGSGWSWTNDEIDEIYESLMETAPILDLDYIFPSNEANMSNIQPHHISPSNEAGTSNIQPHRRGVPWTVEEHRLFLMGLSRYGKGDWKNIARHYVVSKTPTQVASHAQKFFRRERCSTPLNKRRPSIHDIRTVDPTPVTSVPQHQINYYGGTH